MRPEQAHVLAQILTALAAAFARGSSLRQVLARACRVVGPLLLFARFDRVVETPLFIVLNKCAIALARRANSFGAYWPITHANTSLARHRRSQCWSSLLGEDASGNKFRQEIECGQGVKRQGDCPNKDFSTCCIPAIFVAMRDMLSVASPA